MARLYSILALIVALACVQTQAGNRAWESPRQIQNVKLLSTSTLYARNGSPFLGMNSSASVDSNNKRYVAIKPGNGAADTQTWPKGVISYCFEQVLHEHQGKTKTTKEILIEDLKAARQLWFNAGLKEDMFGWKELSESDCADETKRPDFLKISYNDEGLLRTTPGKPPGMTDGDVGPRMKLSDTLTVGMKNVIANYAHEMGHAWGLEHEHQNPRWWSQPYSTSQGRIFGEDNWGCENLKDYARTKALIELKYQNDASNTAKLLKNVCTFQSVAADWRFSASEYLPLDSTKILATSKGNVDWDSIMLYPSSAGALPGTAILKKSDGTPITPNLVPSQRDVDGLVKLYAYNPKRTFTPFGSKASKFRDAFQKIIGKDQASGCI